MNCRELITFLETEVPLETAEGWDNPGFLVGDKVIITEIIGNKMIVDKIKEINLN